MRSKIIAAAAAGALLVGAALVASAVSTPETASAQTEEAPEEGGLISRGLDFLSGVLSGLVSDGTIDQGQADAILTAVEEEAAAVRAQREATREMIRGFLEDDVITADELAQLPEDHPFNDPEGPYAEAVADGELTREEISQVMPHPRRDAFRHGVRFGALLDDGGIDAEEYRALPDDHPLKQVDVSAYLEDGVITVDELRQIWEENRPFADDV